MSAYYRQKLAQLEAKAAETQMPRTAPVRLNCDAKEFDPFKASLKQSQSVDTNNSNSHGGSRAMEKVESSPQKTDTSSINTKKIESKEAAEEFSQTISIREERITITGSSLDLVKTAKIVLHEFFNVIPTEEKNPQKEEDMSRLATTASRPSSTESSSKTAKSEKEDEDGEAGIELVRPKISYNKQELMEMARSPFCQVILASYWSSLPILASHWSILVILVPHWSILLTGDTHHLD